MKLKHGHSREGRRSKTYNVWRGMTARCRNKKLDSYKYYGGRGITVCKRWKNNFSNFLQDMGEKPEGMSIDRIDNDGNYEPSNCKWSTPKEQVDNRRKQSIRVDNLTGLTGVTFIDKPQGRYYSAWAGEYIGASYDFFEVCCMVKSAENKRRK